MSLALFGIDNGALNLTVNLLILFLVVVWLALVAWTFFDARRRMDDQILVWCSVGASLFPFIGTVIYTILRPPEFQEDRRERELEIRAAELRVRQLTEQSCPKCEYPIEKTFLRCPNCQARVKDPCPSCNRPIDPRWAMCPYCETPTRREQPKRRPSERPAREPERAARSQAPPKKRAERPERPAPKRETRAPANRERERTKAPSAAGRRSSGRTAKAAPEDASSEGPSGDSAGEGNSRPATAG